MSTVKDEQTIIVTGASSGIGAAVGQRLSRPGRRVFKTSRHPNQERDGSDAIALDVTSDDSVAEAVATILERTGRIDAIINNAGVDLCGAIEETDSEEAIALFQTNFFGVHRLIRAVLPTMRAQKKGRIVTIGSIAGFLPLPYQSFYSASKYALEGYIESLDYEVRPFGIRVALVEPGYMRTRFSANTVQAFAKIDAYKVARAQVNNRSAHDVGRGSSPEAVAYVVESLLAAQDPQFRTRVGADAKRLYVLRRVLPRFLFSMGMRARLSAS